MAHDETSFYSPCYENVLLNFKQAGEQLWVLAVKFVFYGNMSKYPKS